MKPKIVRGIHQPHLTPFLSDLTLFVSRTWNMFGEPAFIVSIWTIASLIILARAVSGPSVPVTPGSEAHLGSPAAQTRKLSEHVGAYGLDQAKANVQTIFVPAESRIKVKDWQPGH